MPSPHFGNTTRALDREKLLLSTSVITRRHQRPQRMGCRTYRATQVSTFLVKHWPPTLSIIAHAKHRRSSPPGSPSLRFSPASRKRTPCHIHRKHSDPDRREGRKEKNFTQSILIHGASTRKCQTTSCRRFVSARVTSTRFISETRARARVLHGCCATMHSALERRRACMEFSSKVMGCCATVGLMRADADG